MKTLKYIIVIVVLIVFVNSCSDFLDTHPKDYLTTVHYYNTELQLNRALVGVYEILSTPDVYGNSMIGRMGLDADDGYFNGNIPQGGVLVNNAMPVDLIVSNFWKKLYEGINRANILLANVDEPSIKISAKNRSAIKGESLFLRAYYHFLLVSNFGDVPLKLTESLWVEPADFIRTPAKDVYQQIIQDMIEAESLTLPIDSVVSGGRVSKSAVQGVLARVCLYMTGNPINDVSKWKDVAYWSNKVISSGKHELNPNYDQIFINYAKDIYDSKESIWEVEFYGLSETDPSRKVGKVGHNLTIRSDNDESGYSVGNNFATATLFRKFKSYHRTENGVEKEFSPDKRRDWSIAPFYYTPTTNNEKTYWSNNYPLRADHSMTHRRYCGKWRREYEPTTPKMRDGTSQNFPILRYSDVLLMFAEAENELKGPTPEAYNAINQVKRRAYGFPPLQAGSVDEMGNPVDEASLTTEEFRQYIKDERARELSFECVRKRDLVRWGEYVETMQLTGDIMRTEWPTGNDALKRYFTNVQPRDVLFPIPSYEMGLNKKLTQNPGW